MYLCTKIRFNLYLFYGITQNINFYCLNDNANKIFLRVTEVVKLCVKKD